MSNFDQYKFVNEALLAVFLEGNVYIHGSTGSGKSILLIKTIRSLLKVPDGRDIYVFDPKTGEFLAQYFVIEDQCKTPYYARGEDKIKEAISTLEERMKEPSFSGAMVFVDEIGAFPFLEEYILKEGARFFEKGVRFVVASQRDAVFKNFSKAHLEFVRIDLSSDAGVHMLNLRAAKRK